MRPYEFADNYARPVTYLREMQNIIVIVIFMMYVKILDKKKS